MSKHDEKDGSQRDISYQLSHLFLVRVWLEKNARTRYGARLYGRVQDVSTGQAHYFRGCSELAKVLRRMIPQSQVDESGRVARAVEPKDKV